MNVKKVEKLLEQNIEKYNIAGISAVLVDGSESAIINKGYKQAHNQAGLVTDETIFSIGSVTKIFTSVLTCILTLDGSFDIKATIGDYISEPVSDAIKQISILDLLTHTSGLPRLPDNLQQYMKNIEDPYADYGEAELLAYLTTAQLKNPVGAYEYSNLGYGLLGYVLEKSTGTAYQSLLSDKIFSPLKMGSSSIYHASVSPNAAQGYDRKNNQVPYWNMNILQAAGGIISTPADMAQFVSAAISGNSVINNALQLSFEAITDHMALGWHKHNWFLNLIGAKNDLWHNGLTGGFASFLEVNLKRKRGFALMFNKAILPDHIAYRISVAMPCIGY